MKRSHCGLLCLRAPRNARWLAGWAGALLACQVASAQHASGYELPTYVGSAEGTVITGQDGFYIPVRDSQDGLVYTYADNALKLPPNPTGRDQFVGVTGGDTALPVPFARAQRDMEYGRGTGVWTASFDIAATYVGELPSADNIGSFSTQVFADEQTFIALARWTDAATAANWNADYVWFDAAGTQLLEQVPNKAFQGLLTNHWYRWCTVFDLDTNQILEVSITDLTTGETVTHSPKGRFLFGGAAGSATPTGFRYFAGTNTPGAAGNTLGFDNLRVEGPCPWDCQTSAGGPDGNVGINDLLDLLGQWNQVGTSCDLGVGQQGVGIEEFLKILANWGPCK